VHRLLVVGWERLRTYVGGSSGKEERKQRLTVTWTLTTDGLLSAHILFDGMIGIMCNGQRGSIVTQIGAIGTRVEMGEH